VQAAILKQMGSLTAQDAATLAQGISPPAMQVLKKMLPQISFVFDALAAKQGGGGNAAPAGNGAGASDPAAAGAADAAAASGGSPQTPPRAAPPGGSGLPQPQTRLGEMQ
jgi:hypothetical protein